MTLRPCTPQGVGLCGLAGPAGNRWRASRRAIERVYKGAGSAGKLTGTLTRGTEGAIALQDLKG